MQRCSGSRHVAVSGEAACATPAPRWTGQLFSNGTPVASVQRSLAHHVVILAKHCASLRAIAAKAENSLYSYTLSGEEIRFGRDPAV